MKKELDYYKIGNSFGGNQDWFQVPMMKLGGCAAATACDSCISFSKYFGKEELYPYDVNHISKKDYVNFSQVMRPYLKPRWTGIDSLHIYIDGFGTYMEDHGVKNIKMTPFSGNEAVGDAERIIKKKINQGILIPSLTLKHKEPKFKDYVWHWYPIVGYEELHDRFRVKVANYSEWEWFDFEQLWDTGYMRKGGLVLYDL